MEKITCSTTLNNYGWREGWYVEDGGKMSPKSKRTAKLTWIYEQGISGACVETMGGWSFRQQQDAIQFVLTWS